MNRFREAVSLRSYAQTNPLQDYVNEGWAMFKEMNETIALEVVLNLLNVKVEKKEPEKKEAFTVEAKPHEEAPLPEKKEEGLKVAVKDEAKASLNITDIDKDAKAAKEHDFEDVHTN
jgi:preprotein translocase subunit SecA